MYVLYTELSPFNHHQQWNYCFYLFVDLHEYVNIVFFLHPPFFLLYVFCFNEMLLYACVAVRHLFMYIFCTVLDGSSEPQWVNKNLKTWKLGVDTNNLPGQHVSVFSHVPGLVAHIEVRISSVFQPPIGGMAVRQYCSPRLYVARDYLTHGDQNHRRHPPLHYSNNPNSHCWSLTPTILSFLTKETFVNLNHPRQL